MIQYRTIPVGLESAAQLSRLHHHCFDPGWSEASFAALLASPGTLGMLAYDPEFDAPIGLALIRFAGEEAEILTFATHPDHRRQRVAYQLVEKLISYSLLNGIDDIFLEVAEDNHAARTLYEKTGFSYAGRRSNYYAPTAGSSGQDALIMRFHTKKV